MNVRSQEEMFNLNQELNLFQEDSWDFLDVPQTAQNYEYFGEFQDDVYLKKANNSFKNIAIIVSAVLFSALMVVGGLIFLSKSKREYQQISGVASVVNGVSTKHIKGNACSNEEIIEASQLFNNYFKVLNSKQSYEKLYDYCSVTSTFADAYSKFVNSIQGSYDINDCHARALREFGGTCSVDKVSELIEKDGTYYCYVSLNMPSTEDMTEYIYLYSYNMTKYFNTNEVTNENIIRFLLDTVRENPIPCKSKEYCVKLNKKDNGEFVVTDDTLITSACMDAYSSAITQMTRTLDSSKLN